MAITITIPMAWVQYQFQYDRGNRIVWSLAMANPCSLLLICNRGDIRYVIYQYGNNNTNMAKTISYINMAITISNTNMAITIPGVRPGPIVPLKLL